MFTKHTGNFEDNNLVITCEDLYPMDLGNATYTEYKMDETVASYMADNIELFECDLNLIHSHHAMSAFFSGTDTSTLRAEGNDTNCFVSLIVNNAGEYCAAVTRKLQLTKKITVQTSGVSYEFFGEGKKALTSGASPVENVSEETVIQYFMLNVEREIVDNPLDYLDERFKEIEAKKKPSVIIPYVRTTPLTAKDSEGVGYAASTYSPADKDEDFYTWIHKDKKEPETKEGILFDDKTMDDLKVEINWTPNPTLVHEAAVRMIACSFIIDPSKFDLKQWIVRHMSRKYDEIFAANLAFDNWAEFIIEFVVTNFFDEGAPEEVYEDLDTFQATVAEAIFEELSEYADYNSYIAQYLDILQRYI